MRIASRAIRAPTIVGAVAAMAALPVPDCETFAQAPEVTEQARVPTSHANVHARPTSGAVVLVMAAEGTVLPVIGRQGEWVQVQLSPELRETGIVVRWYEGRHSFMNDNQIITVGDEDSGWMHDSTVEIAPVEAQ